MLQEAIEQLRKAQFNNFIQSDWQQEQLNFVPLRGSWHAQAEHDFDLEEEIQHFFKGEEKVLLLLGDSGAGKSLYTQGLINKLWQSYQPGSLIPLWISLPALKNPNRAIEKALKRGGLSPQQIAELKQTQKFIIVLDAYDEIRQNKNLYVTNHLEQWQAKIIITCRHEYIYTLDDYRSLFMPFQNNKGQPLLLKEMHVRLFNQKQIHVYIEQYLKNQKTPWNDASYYQQAIEEIPGLKKLIATPFMLRLAMEVLPQIIERYQHTQEIAQRKQLTQAALYDVFIEHWFIRQEQKLKSGKLISETDNIKPEFWEYAKTLAQAMHAQGVTQVIYETESSLTFDEEAEENPWEAYLNPQNPRTRLLQTACLVREVSPHQYAFIHASLLEYFLTRNLYETLNEKIPTPEKEKPKPAKKSSSQSQDYFNERLLVKEINNIQFLADRVAEQEDFKQSLFERIYASKNNPEQRIAAANAITILNRAKMCFSGLDLSNIQIPNADLSYGILDNVNFSETDLTNVIFRDAWLRNANLEGALLHEVSFGESPYLKHQNSIKSLAYSADGHWLVVGSGDYITLWDIISGERKRVFRNHTYYEDVNLITIIYTDSAEEFKQQISEWKKSHACNSILLIFSKNSWKGFRILTEKKDLEKVKIDPESFLGKELSKINHENIAFADKKHIQRLLSRSVLFKTDPEVDAVAISSNGKMIVSGSLDRLIVWDAQSGKELWTALHEVLVACVAISADDKTIVTGSENGFIYVWDTQSRQLLRTLKHPKIEVEVTDFYYVPMLESVVISIDGNKIVSGGRSDVRVWHTQTGQLIQSFSGDYEDRMASVAISKDGNLVVSGSCTGTIHVWKVDSREKICTFTKGHSSEVTSVAIRTDGKVIVSGGNDKTVRLWDVQTKRVLQTLTGHEKEVIVVAISPNGKVIVSGSKDKTVRVWEAQVDQQLTDLPRHKGSVNSVAANDKLILSGGADHTVRTWDIQTGQALQTFTGHNDQVNSVAITTDSKTAISGGADKVIRIWDVQVGKSIQWEVETGKRFLRNVEDESLSDMEELPYYIKELRHPDSVRSVAISAAGKRAVSASKDILMTWDLQTGFDLQILPPPNKNEFVNYRRGEPSSVAVSLNGIIVVGYIEGTVRVWRWNENWLPHHLGVGPRGEIHRSGMIDEEVGYHELLHVFSYQDKPVWSVTVSADGRRAVAGGEDTAVKVWDIQTGKMQQSLIGHTGTVWNVAINGVGETLASGSSDNTVRVWNVQTGECLAILDGYFGTINSIAWCQNQNIFVTGSKDASLKCWREVTVPDQSRMWQLMWSTNSHLYVHGCRLTRAKGLSFANAQLLQQMGAAVSESQDLLDVENEDKVIELPRGSIKIFNLPKLIRADDDSSELKNPPATSIAANELSVEKPKKQSSWPKARLNQFVSLAASPFSFIGRASHQNPPQALVEVSLFEQFDYMQRSIIKGLKKEKWILLDPNTQIQADRKAEAIRNLKQDMIDIRQRIEAGKITNIKEIKGRLSERLSQIISVSQDKQKQTFWGKRKVTQSSLAKRLKEVIQQIDKEPEIPTLKK